MYTTDKFLRRAYDHLGKSIPELVSEDAKSLSDAYSDTQESSHQVIINDMIHDRYFRDLFEKMRVKIFHQLRNKSEDININVF